jgi:hypothetical protein
MRFGDSRRCAIDALRKSCQVVPQDGGAALGWEHMCSKGRVAFDLFAPNTAELLARCEHLPTIAVLTDTTQNAFKASNALNAVDVPDGKPVAHKLHLDEAEALLTARLAAFMLERSRILHTRLPRRSADTGYETGLISGHITGAKTEPALQDQ